MNSLVGTMNANYIVTFEHSGFFLGTKVVLANNPKAPEPWVCWDWNRNGFSNGGYFKTEQGAFKELCRRVDDTHGAHYWD